MSTLKTQVTCTGKVSHGLAMLCANTPLLFLFAILSWMIITGCAPVAAPSMPSNGALVTSIQRPLPSSTVTHSIPTIAALSTRPVPTSATVTPTLAPPTASPVQPNRIAAPMVILAPLPGSGSASILEENKKPGTSAWYVTVDTTVGGDIAGFADAPSVNAGETIRFAISTRSEGKIFTLEIYRVGWYQGNGGRLVLKAEGLQGYAQGYWNSSTVGVVDCPSCVRDNQLGLLDTRWQYGYSLSVPKDWISGEYIGVLTTIDGANGLIYFVVRQDQHPSELLVQIPVNTDQAYNNWGGDSLYVHDSRLPAEINGGKAALKVSFNRPYARYSISADAQAIRFFERFGYDVTYATSVDIDRDPAILKGHRAFISIGHDEYWTREMRKNIEQARDSGLNLAFLGGNDVYWQNRFEADGDGNLRRVMVMYRLAPLDPLSISDPQLATVRFIDPPVNWPQNSLTGTIFGGIIEQPPGLPWIVAPTAPDWMLAKTGLSHGSSVSALTGKECDSVSDNGFQPSGLVVVAASPMTTKYGEHIICNSTYYTTSTGSAVFNAGTLSWPGSMDGFGHHNPGQYEDQRIIQLVINILASFGAHQLK